jgi:hypothetical protein
MDNDVMEKIPEIISAEANHREKQPESVFHIHLILC